MKYIFVTGSSSGIGKAITEKLLKNGYYVIGTVRQNSDASELHDKFPDRYSHVILDLTNKQHIERLSEKVQYITQNNKLSALVNNSGIAIGGPLMLQKIDEIRHQFEINLFGLISVTQKLLPLLGAKLPRVENPGRIINIGSTNGKITYPFIGAYCATKHALEAISDALRYELSVYGIKVVLIEPGSVNTPIWDKAEKTDLSPYRNSAYIKALENFRDQIIKIGKGGIDPGIVANTVLKSIETENPKIRYVVSGNYIAEWFLPRILPEKIFEYVVKKETGLTNR